MVNLTRTEINVQGVEWAKGEMEDDSYTAVGATDLAEGTILARDSVSGLLVDFVIGGSTNENGIPKAVITYDVAISGAGDFPVRPLISGEVRLEKLVVVADGDSSNVDKVVQDQLRDYSIVTFTVNDLSELDN